jgi:RNA polymerase subunit RPABC4/transcription elongation factor Spt4
MVMAPIDTFTVYVCKDCGAILTESWNACPANTDGNHDIEMRWAELLPEGLEF